MAKQTEKASSNKPTRVIVDIRPGQGTPNQRRLWAKLWQKLIAEVKTGERYNP